MQRLISFDWAIKKILRSKANFEILEGFLSELIAPDKDIKILKILESESNKEDEKDKFNRVDILVEIVPGDIVLIEVQFNTELDFLQRMLYGTSKVITEYLAEGEPYAKIKKVYSVNVLYFDLGQGEDYIYRGTTDFVGIHNQAPLQLTTRQKNLYHRELIRDIYPEYYIIKVNNFDNLAKDTLDEWIYFFKNEEIKSEFKAKGLIKAKQALDILKLSEEERAAYKRYQENRHYQASMVESSYGEGKAEGRAEGKQEEKLAIAKNMVAQGLDSSLIAQVTALSLDTIKKLAH